MNAHLAEVMQEQRGEQGLADAGVGAGDEDNFFGVHDGGGLYELSLQIIPFPINFLGRKYLSGRYGGTSPLPSARSPTHTSPLTPLPSERRGGPEGEADSVAEYSID